MNFLSCLCGSEQQDRGGARLGHFLSCLCGSELVSRVMLSLGIVSELPMRQ